jgi:16S rRNA (cytidine1402-2'-O)-methyltransferase
MSIRCALYVVATPLGNLNDLSLRALDVLASVDTVAAEDTRHSQKLFSAHGLQTRWLTLHAHNEATAASALLSVLDQGHSVALITDAGTPCISDPGARAVAAVREAGHAVIPIPGPSAVTCALSLSGFTHPHFYFYGFLPAKTQARFHALEGLRDWDATLVFYEAPHRILETAESLLAVLGPLRMIFVAREMTKQFEEYALITLADFPDWIKAGEHRQRGEFVLCVSAPPPQDEPLDRQTRRTLELLLAALPLKSAVKLACEITGAQRNRLYDYALEVKSASGPADDAC